MPRGRSLIERETSAGTIACQATTIPELFERQVEESPNAPALIAFGKRISFAELNERANQLAHYLQEMGVTPETLVGICLDRSPEMLVGILGILKAGGAYVPLDPGYPEKRLAYILSDARVGLVLTSERLIGRLPQEATRLICMDQDWPIISKHSPENLVTAPGPEHLAYVLYTSGSTGNPKGVAMPHAPAMNLLRWQTTHFSFLEPCRVLQFTSLNFDVSFQEIFSTWCSGNTIVLVPDDVRKDPPALCRFISEMHIQRIFAPFIALKHLAEAGVAERVVPTCLREVITAGEQLQVTPQIVEFFSQIPEATLENQYGPTEAHVVVTSFKLHGEPSKWPRLPPIGKPIALSKILVLDGEKRPVAIEAEGELFIGGDCLARGYYNRPELTNERFVLDASGSERLYKTGDWGRIRSDGNIEFLGRIDHQVKIRGNRVELGEIEVLLSHHPTVQSAVVVARECSDGIKQLVAYVVPNPETPHSTSALRTYLKESLPDYSVPSVFAIVDTLPLTPNGKVDRVALLQQPLQQKAEETALSQATSLEKTLVHIWQEVLSLEHVGLNDKFFDIGGDSILSVRIAARARQAGIHCSMQQLAENPTVSQQAKQCSRCDSTKGQQLHPFDLVAPADREKLPVHAEDAYPLTALQAGMVFHSELDPESLLYHEVYTFRVSSAFTPEVMQSTIDRLIERHPVLRTSFHLATFSEPMQVVHQDASTVLQVVDLRDLASPEDALQAAIEKEKETLFKWSAPPLLRFRVLWLEEKRFDLIVCFHHAILDGWSLATMIEEFFHDYLRLLKGEKVDLSSPTFNFAEYIALERTVMNSDSCRAFWQTKLAERPNSRLPMRGAKSSPGKASIRSSTMSVSCSTKTGLLGLAQTAGVSLKTVLHAAHHRVLGILTGKSDVISGLSVDGRMAEIDAEHTLGLFVNVVPVRIKLERGSWLDLVRQVARGEQEIFPLRRYPLSEIQKFSGGALFDASFSFLRFQAYKSLHENPELRLTEGPFFEATNSPFLVTFQVQADTDELTLQLDCDIGKIDPGIIAFATSCYAKILHEMAFYPTQCHETFCSSLREGNVSGETVNEAVLSGEKVPSHFGDIVGARVMSLVHLVVSYGAELPSSYILTA